MQTKNNEICACKAAAEHLAREGKGSPVVKTKCFTCSGGPAVRNLCTTQNISPADCCAETLVCSCWQLEVQTVSCGALVFR